MNILLFSYNWKKVDSEFLDLAIGKYERNRLSIGRNKIFHIVWGLKKRLIGNKDVKIQFLKARFKHVRVIYDILLMFCAPFIIWKKKFKPDVVFVRDFQFVFSAWLIKVLFKSKIVFYLASEPRTLAKTKKNSFLYSVYQILSENLTKDLIDVYLANGVGPKKYLENLGIEKDRVQIMPGNTIVREMNKISRAESGKMRKKFNITDDKKILLTVSRLEPEKNLDILIKSFKDLKRSDLVLIIVGPGSIQTELEEYVEGLGIKDRVYFTGRVVREEIWNYYLDSDVFIFLSLSEGTPTVIREAMYMNLPIICSPIDGNKYFVGENKERGFFWQKKYGIEELNGYIDACLSAGNEIIEIKKRAKNFIDDEINDRRVINDYINESKLHNKC